MTNQHLPFCILYKIFIILFSTSFFIACGGGGGSSSGGSGNNMNPTSTPTPTPEVTQTPTPEPTATTATATLSQLQSEIFTPRCSGCHSGGGAPQGLRLDSEANTFNDLVNVASNERPEILRVDPGSPDDSYLIHKVTGASGIVGGQMPLGQTPLTSDQINMMRDWIENGALQTGSAFLLQKVHTQDDIETLYFELEFSSNIDPSSVTENSVLVYLHNDYGKILANRDVVSVQTNNNEMTIRVETDFNRYNTIEFIIDDPSHSLILSTSGHTLTKSKNMQLKGIHHTYDL